MPTPHDVEHSQKQRQTTSGGKDPRFPRPSSLKGEEPNLPDNPGYLDLLWHIKTARSPARLEALEEKARAAEEEGSLSPSQLSALLLLLDIQRATTEGEVRRAYSLTYVTFLDPVGATALKKAFEAKLKNLRRKADALSAGEEGDHDTP